MIVGAGPAGSSLALFLAQEGIPSLLIERHSQIGVPLSCAEGVGRDIEDYIEMEERWICTRLSGARFTYQDGQSFKTHYPQVGYILDRKIFDRDLAARAVSSGAKVLIETEAIGIEGNELIVKRNKKIEKIGFRILVGADGVESRVGRWFGLNTSLKRDEIHSCAQYLLAGIEIDPTVGEFVIGPDIAPGGYIWIFPKGKDRANVGIGVSPILAKHSPLFYLERFIRERFPKSSRLERMRGVVGAKILKEFSKKNVLLVGDAARLTDPISGGGIVNAIHSSKLASSVIKRVLKGNGSLKDYERRLEEELLKELKVREKLREIALKLKREDFSLLIQFGMKNLKDRDISQIGTMEIFGMLIKSTPRFLRLAGHILPLIGFLKR